MTFSFLAGLELAERFVGGGVVGPLLLLGHIKQKGGLTHVEVEPILWLR